MFYKQVSPGESLKDYIKYFWFLECETSATIRAVADGCPGIIFHQTENGLYLNQKKKLSNFFLYGQTIKPIEMNASGNFRITGIYFYPHIIKTLFGFDASEFTDACLDLNLLPVVSNINLTERLVNTISAEEQISIISEYLHNLIIKNNLKTDTILHYAIRHLLNTNGKIPLSELHKSLNLSQRTFERKFEQYIGISPRLFSRICRFQASLNQLRNTDYLKLSDIAFDNGYTDQSHFIRSFKEFTGLSPLKFEKESFQLAHQSSVLIK